MTKTPNGLAVGGRSLWAQVTEEHDLDVVQLVQLEEACRAKDRLDKLDRVLRGDEEVWMRLTHELRTDDYEVKIDDALGKANATANLMKQLLSALRLPDVRTGKRPQYRGARGAYAGTSRVSSLDMARRRQTPPAEPGS